MLLCLRKVGLLTPNTVELGIALLSVIVSAWVIFVRPRVPNTQTTIVLAGSLVFLGTIVGWLTSDTGASTANTALGGWAMEVVPYVVFLTVASAGMSWDRVADLILQAGSPIVLASAVAGVLNLEPAWTTLAGVGSVEDVNRRLSGVLASPNTLGSAAAVWTVVGLYRLRPRMSLLIFAIGTATVYLTDQRSALIPLLAVGVWRTYLGLSRSAPKSYRPIFGIAFTAFVVATYSMALAGLEAVTEKRVASAESRTQLWRYLLDHWEAYFPFGLGPRGVYNLALTDNSLMERFFHAHNQVLTFAVTGGVITLFGLMVLGIKVLWLTCHTPDRRVPTLVVLLSLMAFESPLHVGMTGHLVAPSALAWLCVTLLLAPDVSVKELPQPRQLLHGNRGLARG